MGFVSNIIRSSEFVGPVTGLATSASYATFAETASYVSGVGYLTGSLLVTASITGSNLEFTKGDGTTFAVELPTASFSGSGVEGDFTITDGDLYVKNNDINLTETGSSVFLFGNLNTGSFRLRAQDDSKTGWTRFSIDYKDLNSYQPQLVLTTNSMSLESNHVAVPNTFYAPAMTGSLLGNVSGSISASAFNQGGMTQTVYEIPGYPFLSNGYVLFSYPLTDETAAFIEYNVSSNAGAPNFEGYNQRSGIIAATFTTAGPSYGLEWSDNSTGDIGDTSDFEINLVISPNVSLTGWILEGLVTASPVKNYKFKHIARLM